MSAYYYRGKRYKRQTKGQTVWRSVKKIARRVEEAIQGDHPGGAEALVDWYIQTYPEKPKQPEPTEPAPQPDNPSEKK